MLRAGRKIRNTGKVSFFKKNTSFSKKLEVTGTGKIIHQLTGFSMLIPNMMVFLHKSLVLVVKIEVYVGILDTWARI
jgi:hypothetical protein